MAVNQHQSKKMLKRLLYSLVAIVVGGFVFKLLRSLFKTSSCNKPSATSQNNQLDESSTPKSNDDEPVLEKQVETPVVSELKQSDVPTSVVEEPLPISENVPLENNQTNIPETSLII